MWHGAQFLFDGLAHGNINKSRAVFWPIRKAGAELCADFFYDFIGRFTLTKQFFGLYLNCGEVVLILTDGVRITQGTVAGNQHVNIERLNGL